MLPLLQCWVMHRRQTHLSQPSYRVLEALGTDPREAVDPCIYQD